MTLYRCIKPYKLSTTCAIGLFPNGRTFLKTDLRGVTGRSTSVVGKQAAWVGYRADLLGRKALRIPRDGTCTECLYRFGREFTAMHGARQRGKRRPQ